MKLLILVASLLLSSATIAGVVNRTFKVPTNPTIDFEADLGAVSIVGGSGSEVKIEATGELATASNLSIEGKLDGQVLKLTAKLKNRDGYGGIRYIIEVPQKSGHKIATKAGSIAVENIHGNIAGQTYGGSISLEKSKGKVKMKTKGGSISIEDFSGDLEVESAGGSIDVEKAVGKIEIATKGGSMDLEDVQGPINAETGGGSIDIVMTKALAHPLKARTGGGSISLKMTQAKNADIEARTGFGKVYLFGASRKLIKSDDKKLSYKFDDGKFPVNLRTGAGSIEIFSN